MARLDEIFDLQMGKTPSRNNADYWTDGQYDWVSIADLGSYQKYVEDTKERISALAVQESGIKSVPANTVIMSFKLSLGKTAITQEPVYTNEAIMAFIPTGKYAVLPDYFYYLFSAKDWTKGTNRAVMGTTLNKAILGAVSITVPPIDEQRKIAAILDKVSSLIAKRHQQLDRLDELVKSRFVEMFGDILYDTNLPLIQLNELADIGSSKRIYANEYVELGVPFYRSKEIRELGCGLKPSVELFIKQERYDEIKDKYGVPKIGDILIAAIGATIGYSWIVDTENPFYYKDGNLILLSIKNNVNPIFLNHALGILIENFKKKGVAGSAQLALTIEKLEKMMVVNPDFKLQEQFATFVTQVDKSKLAIQKSLEQLETLKKALMQEYFV